MKITKKLYTKIEKLYKESTYSPFDKIPKFKRAVKAIPKKRIKFKKEVVKKAVQRHRETLERTWL